MTVFKKLIAILVLSIFSCIAFSSCATIINGKRQKVTIQTDPPGAVVSDGKESHLTPATLQLERKNEHQFTIVKPGFASQTVVISKIKSNMMAANIIMPLSVVCIGIDAATGADYRLVPEKVDVKLQPTALKK